MENNNYYEPQTRHKQSSINWREVLLKILFIALFVVLLLWLFPMPNLNPLYDHMFNENVMMMKDSAKNYYSNERLPQEVGDKVGMSLQDMLNKHLMLPIVDGEGNLCDANASYVEVTKLDTEWQLKAYLSCGTKADYVIEYLGCTDYCGLAECEVVSIPEEIKEEKKAREKTITEYQFYKKTSDSGWSNWSTWSETYKNESSTIRREARTFYKGRIWSSDPIYNYEYEREVVQGKKWIAKPVYNYEYARTLIKGRKWIEKIETVTAPGPWGNWTNWSTTNPGAATNLMEVQVGSESYDTGAKKCTSYGYTGWSYVGQIKSTTRLSTYVTATEKITEAGQISVDNCAPNVTTCYSRTVYFLYNKETRSQECKTTEPVMGTRTIYKYRTRTNVTTTVDNGYYKYTDWLVTLPSDYKAYGEQKTETKMAATSPGTEWTATGKKEQTGDEGKFIYTEWVATLPEGYDLHLTKKETKMSKTTTLEGWTATGKKEKIGDAGGYIYSDWGATVPSGYEIIGERKEYRYSYYSSKENVEYMWSAEKTVSGWNNTGKTRTKTVKY